MKTFNNIIIGGDSINNKITVDTSVSIFKPKKGHWENGNPICPCCGEDKFKDLDADIWADWKPNYCPNCGADMRKSEGK